MNPFAYAVAEWREWLASRRPLATAAAALVLAASASLAWLAPATLSLFLPLSALVLGWESGSRYAAESRFRKLLLGAGLSATGSALARCLEATAEALFNAATLSPPVALTLLLWGRGPESAAFILLSYLATSLLSSAAGFLASLLLGGSGRILGLWFFFVWIPASSLVEPLRALSPFRQAWAGFAEQDPRLASLAPALLGELAVAALLFAAAIPAVGRARRGDAAR